MVGFDDRRRSNIKVAAFVYESRPNREQVFKSTVLKTLRRCNETGNGRNLQRTGRPRNVTNGENSFNIMLDVTENPKISREQLALNHNTSRSLVQKIRKNIIHKKFIYYKNSVKITLTAESNFAK